MSQITACIITRDAPSVFEAIASVRPHVDAVVVVDTGSTDESFLAMLAAISSGAGAVFYDGKQMPEGAPIRVERFTECNDRDGKIADFSLARQRSFDLASTPWVVWLDSDDVVEGAQNLRGIAAQVDARLPPDIAAQLLFYYEYSYHPSGQVSCLQKRERMIRHPRTGFRWHCPVHEVCLPVDPSRTFIDEVLPAAVWKHRRGQVSAPSDPGRNLRIMRRWVATEEGSKDVRARFYLAQELSDAGELDEALQHYDWHFRRSGWDDERMMGMMRSCSINLSRDDVAEAERCAQRMVELRDDWGEGWFALGRCAYVRADRKLAAGDQSWRADAARAVRHLRRGLALPPTQTPLFIDMRERAVAVHEMLNKTLSDLGEIDAALQSCEEGLRAEPSNPNLLFNRLHYKRIFAVRDSHAAIDSAAAAGAIGPDIAESAKQALAAALGGNVGRIGVGNWPAAVRHPAGYPAEVSEEARPVAALTPHAHAWGIPDSFEAVGLPLRMSDAQLRSLVLALWHELVLHDELVTAEYLLEHAPYRVRADFDVRMALKVTRKFTAWMDDAAEVQRVNAPADPNVETGDVLPGPMGMAAGQRLGLVLSRLRPGERVLDLGCFDGAFTNRMGLAGVKVTGVDQAARSIALARAKAEEFQTGAEHICVDFDSLEQSPMPQRFETVTTTDVWEHMRDPGQLVRVAEKHLLPGGRMLVVTPLGSWMRGRVIPWAHPWRWGAEVGKPWICDEARAHLHAPSSSSVFREFDAEVWRVVNCHAVRSDFPDTEGQGWVFAEAEFVGSPRRSAGTIVFVLGPCWERWTPRTAARGGIGGSETAVIEISRRFAAAGWDVIVYGDLEQEDEGYYGGVLYLRHEKAALCDGADVAVAWRDAALLRRVGAKLSVLWVHDVWAGGGSNDNLLRADVVFGLSRWHCDFLREHHHLPAEQVVQTRNGVDAGRFYVDQYGALANQPEYKLAPQRDAAKAVYSSSPDRGLWALLQMWPRIRERVPTATLHVFYGFENWEKSAAASGDAGQQANIAQLRARLAELAPLGVVARGRVDQAELAREFLSAGAWLYPTWFSESSCITAAEAQCAGLYCVYTPIAALAETVLDGDHAYPVSGDWLSAEYQDLFVEAAVEALRDGGELDRDALKLRAVAAFDWAGVASQWERLFAERLPEQPRLPPYVPHRDFRREGRTP